MTHTSQTPKAGHALSQIFYYGLHVTFEVIQAGSQTLYGCGTDEAIYAKSCFSLSLRLARRTYFSLHEKKELHWCVHTRVVAHSALGR